MVLHPNLRKGTLNRLLAELTRTVPILAVRPASRRMSTKVRIFIEHLEKTFALCSQFNPRPGYSKPWQTLGRRQRIRIGVLNYIPLLLFPAL